MAQKYKNIPVKPEVYVKVQLIADANNRGLGDQVKDWVERELPECEHKKQAVSIETFEGPSDTLGPASVLRPAWYCSICKRVYAKITEEELKEEDGRKLLKAVR